MTPLWSKMLEIEKEGLNGSKWEPPLRALEESSAPEKEEIVSKGLQGRIEVPAESQKKIPDREEEFKPPSALVAHLVNQIIKTMVEMRNLSKSSLGKFSDPAFGQEFHRRMIELIDNSEADLNCFLEYLRIKSPVRETNMIHVILEKALEKHKKKLMDKEIRILKKQFEKDLPNASVHVEELRFILNWVLEYAIISAVPNQSIVLLTRSLEFQEGKMEIGFMQQRGAKSVEIIVAIGDYEKPKKQTGAPLKRRTAQEESEHSGILSLVDEITQKNRGSLKLSADSESRLSMISLILPVERRKVVHYEQARA